MNCLILPKRPAESAEAYETIWWEEGSPLVEISRRVQSKLAEKVGMPVELAMRYQNPSIDSAAASLKEQGVDELVVVPLFPHYAMSSYESAAVEVERVLAKDAPEISVSIIPAFYDHPEYLSAMVAASSEYLQQEFDHLLFSFHGLPERHLRKSDPTGSHCLATEDCCEGCHPAHEFCYRAQSYKTVAEFVKLAGIPEGKYSVSFQSRLGRDPWLKPYTDKVIEDLPNKGVKKLLVMCPAFVSDCLETLEEIGIRGKEDFIKAGGEELQLIPCMNEHSAWVDALEKMVAEKFT